MKIAEILTEQELNELLNLASPQQLPRRERVFTVQPDSVKSAQRVKKLKTQIAVDDAKQEPTEEEMVLAMWQARDLQKQANRNQAASQKRVQ